MASDWQIGDLAVCVDNSRSFGTGGRWLKLGAAYTVTQIGLCEKRRYNLLWLAEVKSEDWLTPGAFAADRFRKIRPDAHEACEEEFVTLLKRKKVSA